MPEEDVRHEYDIAVELYKEGAFSESLVLLERLAKERPDSRHVMYSRGLCLAALGRLEEARAIRDQLSGSSGRSARQFTQKLDAVLKEKLQEREKNLPKGKERSGSQSKTTESIAERSGRPFRVILIAGFLIACVVAVVWVASNQDEQFASDSESIEAHESFSTGTAPDRYVEVAVFYPTGTERSFVYAVFVVPAGEEISNASTEEKDDCVGNSTVNDWSEVKARAKKALAMNNSSSEEIRGVPRNKTACTVVLPRTGIALSSQFEGKEIETFAAGGVTLLSGVVASCGKSAREEIWTQQGQKIGLSGTTYWWGRVGLAADDAGAITHVLIRAYPGDKR